LEESIRFTSSEDVFYNPNMRFCRSMASLAVGAIGGKIDVVDAFCASGIRGIRYAKENKNVQSLTFIDIEKKAISLARKNAKANKLKADGAVANISKAAFEHSADLLEIDPFGTPSPYLIDGFRFFNTKKKAYLSATATDVAVLCGGKIAPCMKNYHAKPLNNDFTHETGLRILIKRIAEVAAEFNMGMKPLVSFSDRHYLKVVAEVSRSADLAYDAMKSIGHVWSCPSCGARGFGDFPEKTCSNCAPKTPNPEPKTPGPERGTDWAGPLWLGELHDKAFLKKMSALNNKRGYADREDISAMLSAMEGEVGMPPFFYNVHALCKMAKTGAVAPLAEIMDSIRASGHRVSRTHFSPIGIKTDAPYKTIVEAIRWKG
ncbi:MAG: tRNA (guanine(10)-N(2))-dimethyltransferase, partial [Candidatus Micrarchaeota archaeon]